MHKSVLVVEDEFLIAMDIQLLLERRRWSVLGIAATVEKALELLAHDLPAVATRCHPKGRLRNTRGRGAARAEHTPRRGKRLQQPGAYRRRNPGRSAQCRRSYRGAPPTDSFGLHSGICNEATSSHAEGLFLSRGTASP